MGSINIVDAVKITDNEGNIADVDQYTNNFGIIATEHKKIHEGKGFTFNKNFIVPKNGYLDVLIVNPAGNFPHLRYYGIEATGAPCEICLFENVITNTDGDIQTLSNNNLNSANTPNLQVYLNADISDYGDEIDCDFIVGSKVEGGNVSPLALEWVLVPSSKYNIRFANKSGDVLDLNFHLFFYE